MNRTICTARELLAAALVLLAPVGNAGATQLNAGPAPGLQILVPAYSYPATNSPVWAALTSAATEAPIIAIANPGNGPGGQPDRNYRRAIRKLRQAGGHVIGYVHTRYAERPVHEVTRDIDAYVNWYGVDGIFVDEMTSRASPGTLSYYRAIYRHVRRLSPKMIVIGNPGTPSDPVWLDLPAFDYIIEAEGPMTRFASVPPPKLQGMLIYDVPTERAMIDLLDRAVANNTAMVYATNDFGLNPWDSLPPYWHEQVRCVAQLNQNQRCRIPAKTE